MGLGTRSTPRGIGFKVRFRGLLHAHTSHPRTRSSSTWGDCSNGPLGKRFSSEMTFGFYRGFTGFRILGVISRSLWQIVWGSGKFMQGNLGETLVHDHGHFGTAIASTIKYPCSPLKRTPAFVISHQVYNYNLLISAEDSDQAGAFKLLLPNACRTTNGTM